MEKKKKRIYMVTKRKLTIPVKKKKKSPSKLCYVSVKKGQNKK